ncbi:LuxR C-terminal-related transcriptional regulator [Nocardioides panacisoli]|uniref:LuxR C-terminal-related transcriptional regulator n=1 Tax=Nocardioides panacisoli TaxID=627624 RepID=UPI001C62F0DF|nr:LuxR C-terminal-related transcriptional regulator [Nocardioides panacisoli]QYJ04828.1 LuxR C-terminal-related transcriptional regulator [Nocardioides panacisoli]
MTTGQQYAAVVYRSRLVARLERLRHDPAARHALLAAPPGFGKSTLVRSWLQEPAVGVPVALTHLRDIGDDRRSLWQRVLTALTRVTDETVGEALGRLPLPDRSGGRGFVTELFDVLGGVPIVLVLDDVHEVSGGAIPDLDRLLAGAPDSLRLVLLSRTRPPLPALTDLRIHGELDVLAAPDLAFSREECAECCPHLTPEQQDLVWERTEGWPTMVQLMALALERSRDLDDADWPGVDGLADRLFGEVFQAQDTNAQQVLLRCSVADPMPLALLVRLAGCEDAGEVLARVGGWSGLLRESSGTSGVPDYRLHPILRAYLHGELVRRDASAARDAEIVSAAWFLDRGDGLRAVRHAVASQSREVLEATLAAVGPGLVADGLAPQLVQALGSRLFRGATGPWTAVVGAAALVDQGRTAPAAALHEMHPEAHDDDLRAAQASVGALLRRRRGRPCGDLVAIPDHPGLDVEMSYSLHHGAELLRAGELADSRPLLRRAVDIAEGRAHGALLVDALTFQAGHDAATGDFPAMREHLGRARTVAEDGGWTGSPRAALLHMLEGWLAHLDLDDVRARTLGARAAELVDPDDDPSTVVAVDSLVQGVVEGAAQLDTNWVHECWRHEGETRLAPDLVAGVALADARVSLHLGRTDRLREVVEGLLHQFGPTAETRLGSAYLELARGRPARGTDALAAVLDGDAPAVWPLTLLEAHVLAVRLALAQDHRFRAIGELRRALGLAQQLGTPRPLLGLEADGLALLTEGQGSWGPQEEVVQRVLEYVAAQRGPSHVQLTDREVDVLRELPTLRTVDEIAHDMVVSVNTLKTHLRNIYRKLGVSSRREAVSEARRAGLL